MEFYEYSDLKNEKDPDYQGRQKAYNEFTAHDHVKEEATILPSNVELLIIKRFNNLSHLKKDVHLFADELKKTGKMHKKLEDFKQGKIRL